MALAPGRCGRSTRLVTLPMVTVTPRLQAWLVEVPLAFVCDALKLNFVHFGQRYLPSSYALCLTSTVHLLGGLVKGNFVDFA